MTEIEKYNPCEEAIEFRKKFDSFEDAWNACERGDWMLWIADRLSVDIKILTKAKALCASTVRHLMNDKRSLNAIDTALAFGDGNATREELYSAADAAASAASAAAASAYAAYASAADAKRKNLKKTADICREILTNSVFEKLQEAGK